MAATEKLSAREYLLEMYQSEVHSTPPEAYPTLMEDLVQSLIVRYPRLMRTEKEAINVVMLEQAKEYCQKHHAKIYLEKDCRPVLDEIERRLDAVQELKPWEARR
jgi:hypothetical protein